MRPWASSPSRTTVSIQAISKHLKVLEDAGLVSRKTKVEPQRREVHLEAEVFDLMTKWIERSGQRGGDALGAPGRSPTADR